MLYCLFGLIKLWGKSQVSSLSFPFKTANSWATRTLKCKWNEACWYPHSCLREPGSVLRTGRRAQSVEQGTGLSPCYRDQGSVLAPSVRPQKPNDLDRVQDWALSSWLREKHGRSTCPCLAYMTSFNPPDNSARWGMFSFIAQMKKTEAQQSYVTFPTSHSKCVPLVLLPKSPGFHPGVLSGIY